MKNILIVTHYFPPEIGAPQARLSEMAKIFAETQDVTVLTGMPNHPTGIIANGYEKCISKEEFTDNYRILRSWVYATPNEGFIKKTLSHISFMISSILLNYRKVKNVDVVIVSSPTFFSIFAAYFIAKTKRAKFVLEIRDLWPGIFIELGVLTNKYIIALLTNIEMFFYQQADLVITVTQGFKDNIVERGILESKVKVIRNGADVDKFSPLKRSKSTREKFKAKDNDLVVLYSGAHGISHGLDSVVDAAELLKDSDDIKFVFVGEGAKKRELINQAKYLNNVLFLPSVNRQQMPDLIANADICLAPLKDVPLFSTFIPSKIFEYMAMSKPVIGCLTGEPASILLEAGQIVIEPENPRVLAETVKSLSNDKHNLNQIGIAGRNFVTKNFNRSNLNTYYLELINQL
jgi:glycosyltransferase involved in cell wall biosynthesis